MNLVFVTGSFPFGLGETFIENEIQYLADAFEYVYIYTCNQAESNLRTVESNVTAFPANERGTQKYLLKAFASKAFWNESKRILGNKNYFRKCHATLRFLESVECASDNIEQFVSAIPTDNPIVIYSYWLSHIGMTAINIQNALKNRGCDTNIIARCHGFDLYQERAYLSYLPFQDFMLKRFDRIFPCSAQGTKYLQEKYPEYKGKIEVAYLGIPDRVHGVIPKNNPFSIVSCSNVIPIKRVIRIAEALTQITDNSIHWIHFGDGELFEQLKEFAWKKMPPNVTVEFLGRVPNAEIYRYYQSHSSSVFVNVSSSEGLPVSIMEACSFGIPVIATDVGGTSEIVTDGENGMLLDENFSTADLAKALMTFINMDADEYRHFCKASRKRYETRFSAEKNYPAFCEMIINKQ